MYRATTPTHEFILKNLSGADVHKLIITYAQNNKTILEKRENDAQVENGKISISLSQEETKLFTHGLVSIQLRVLTPDGKALQSAIFTVPVFQVLNDEVMKLADNS